MPPQRGDLVTREGIKVRAQLKRREKSRASTNVLSPWSGNGKGRGDFATKKKRLLSGQSSRILMLLWEKGGQESGAIARA